MIYRNSDYRAASACERARLYEPEIWDEQRKEEDEYYTTEIEEDEDYDII